MNEKEYDRFLGIKTAGTLELLNQSVHYNRYEASPYVALEDLFQEYEVHSQDSVVDFGSGKGRISFFIHQRFQASVTGVEMNGQLYQDAIVNMVNYRKKHKQTGGVIRFENCLAETYEVKSEDNQFYFFNPFSIQIFMKVISNILLSVEKCKRSVTIILYYPHAEYIQFLETSTPLELMNKVKVSNPNDQSENDRFMIYRYA